MSVPVASLGLNVMAAPEFIAGFIFGFTQYNHLVEIEQCYQGSDNVIFDVEKALGDFKEGSYLKGLELIGDIIDDMNIALANCESMGGDF